MTSRSPKDADGSLPRVLIVLDSLGTGGTERQMEMLIRHWPGGTPPTVCSLSSGGPARARFAAHAPVHTIPRSRRMDLFQSRKLAEIVDRTGAQVVLAAHRYAGLVAKLSRLFHGRPVVCSVRGRHSFSRLQHWIYDGLDLAAMRWASAVIVNSRLVGEEIEENPWFRGRIEVVYNGVEDIAVDPGAVSALAARWGGVEDAPLLVAVGRLVDVKDPLVTLEVLARLRRSGWPARLMWVGDGPLRETMELRARALGIEAFVHLIGELADPRPALALADVVIHPSSWENTSNAILESMIMARPVVARRVGGNAELIRDGESGRLVDSRGENLIEGFVAAIHELLASPETRSAMGANARARALERFGVASMVEGHVRTLARAVEEES